MVERDSCSIEYPLGDLYPIQTWDLSRISSDRIFTAQMVPNEFGATPTVTSLNLTLEQSILSLQNYSFYYFALFDISKSLVCELGPTSIDGFLENNSTDSKKVIYLSKSIFVENGTIPVGSSSSSSNSLDTSWVAVIILSVVAVLIIFILAFLRLKKKSRFRRRRLNQTHVILPPSLDIHENRHSYQSNEEEGVELPSIIVSSPSSTSSTISTLGEDFQNIDQAKPFFDVEKGVAKNNSSNSNKFLSVDETRIVLGEPMLSFTGNPFDSSKSLFSEHIQTDNSMVSKSESNLESTSTNHETSHDVQNIQNIPTEDLESSSIPDSEYYDAQSISSHDPMDHNNVRWETAETGETGDDLSFQSAKSQSDSSLSLYYTATGGSISRSSQSNQSIDTRPSFSGSARNSKSSNDGGYLTAESESEGEDMDAMSIASNVVVADRIYFPGDITRRERRASCVSETTIKQGPD